ncbi:uncharacterized protein VTP21DRAFT_7425 [Calcarisporiella thermophila]|uniref:uncharacterized protein n=1 Tax=Calcarisporiella thermophila TaxID=911321 RepID=UPI003742E191
MARTIDSATDWPTPSRTYCGEPDIVWPEPITTSILAICFTLRAISAMKLEPRGQSGRAPTWTIPEQKLQRLHAVHEDPVVKPKSSRSTQSTLDGLSLMGRPANGKAVYQLSKYGDLFLNDKAQECTIKEISSAGGLGLIFSE